jgi:hypothetical protein
LLRAATVDLVLVAEFRRVGANEITFTVFIAVGEGTTFAHALTRATRRTEGEAQDEKERKARQTLNHAPT